MKSWVFDTNIIVAAHLSPFGPPAKLLGAVYARGLRISYDARLAAEYREVLLRPKFGLPAEAVRSFFQVLEDQDLVTGLPLNLKVPDPDDLMFLEVAAATTERRLITGNLRHFPVACRGPVTVMTPAEAWIGYCGISPWYAGVP
jgi:putative PIN family toxin of toxin-antitoxin system